MSFDIETVVVYRGHRRTYRQLCAMHHIMPATLRERLRRGWSLDDALSPVSGTRRRRAEA